MRIPAFTPRSLPRLQPSSVDERIRKAYQCPKTNAILRYLPRGGGVKPLHPAYVCWWNSCENLADWTISPEMTGSIDTADYQENVGSLALDVPAGATAYPSARVDINACDKYFGFWAQIWKTRYLERFRVYKDGGNYMEFYTSTADRWIIAIRVAGGTVKTSDSGVSCLPLGTWFWLEIFKQHPTHDRYTFRINGVPVGEFAGYGDFGVPVGFLAGVNRQVGVDHGVKVDYVRVADRWEYPPA